MNEIIGRVVNALLLVYGTTKCGEFSGMEGSITEAALAYLLRDVMQPANELASACWKSGQNSGR